MVVYLVVCSWASLILRIRRSRFVPELPDSPGSLGLPLVRTNSVRHATRRARLRVLFMIVYNIAGKVQEKMFAFEQVSLVESTHKVQNGG